MKKSVSFIAVLFCLFLLLTSTQQAFTQQSQQQMIDDFKAAVEDSSYAQFIEKYKPHELAFVALQRLAKPFIDDKNWEKAASVFEHYRNDFPNMKARIDKIIALLKKPEDKIRIRNLGEGINSDVDDILPVISADGKSIYFIREKFLIYLAEEKMRIDRDENIFVSHYQNGNWGEAYEMENPIKTDSPEGVLSVSADGNTLILFGNYEGSIGRGDIFFTQKTVTGWSPVSIYPPPINSEYFDADAMMTADGKAMIFVSDRPGGIGEFHAKDSELFHGGYWGNTDIYVCMKTDTGWSKPINLGDKINTPYCERTPFLHPDGKSLYFSSDGHYGLGYLDVFKATRLSDTSWTEWSEPVNLGKAYNGSEADWGYKISTIGNLAYMASSTQSDCYGKSDIYAIELLDTPELVTTVSGKVTDPDGNPLQVSIIWNDLTLNKEVGEATSDPVTGEYFIALPAGKEYSYSANKENYFAKSEHLDLTDKKDFTEYKLDITMYPIEELKKGENSITIKFENIFFDFDKWELKEKSKLELNRWVELLKQNPEISLKIMGHTDNTGNKDYNQMLSEKRAEAVRNYLVEQGIEKNRLIALGFGEDRPISSNETKEGRSKNRRVEASFGQFSAK